MRRLLLFSIFCDSVSLRAGIRHAHTHKQAPTHDVFIDLLKVDHLFFFFKGRKLQMSGSSDWQHCEVCFHLVLTGLIQDIKGLHRHSLAVVVQLCDQQLHAPTTEELHTRTQQHTEVFGGIQSAGLLSNTGSIVGEIKEFRIFVSLKAEEQYRFFF